MADIKWIKITTDIFDDEKIKIIDTYPARDEIIVIWFKLLALAGKVNQSGLLFLANKIAYTPDMLSTIFNRERNVVEMALGIFENFGMISIEYNDVIAICNWEKHQNVEGMEKVREQTRQRVSYHRGKQKMLSQEPCNVTVTLRNAIELELELEEDKELKKGVGFHPPSLIEVSEYCSSRSNGIDAEQFIDFYKSKGWMVGKTKMKDWKASVRTWEKRHKGENKEKGEINLW